MKIVLISDDQKTAARINSYFTPLGYGFMQYTNPLKAMDNFKEIVPDVVLFHESDFPRHWKLAVQFLREQLSRERAIFILLVDALFDEEDVHKAHFLGVNGLFPADHTMESLESMILRYKVAPEVRKNQHLIPLGNKKMDLMFMNPSNLQLVNCHILEISLNGAVLKMEEPFKAAGLEQGSILKNCSLKTDAGIVNLNIRIEHMGGILDVAFLDGAPEWQDMIRESIEGLC